MSEQEPSICKQRAKAKRLAAVELEFRAAMKFIGIARAITILNEERRIADKRRARRTCPARTRGKKP